MENLTIAIALLCMNIPDFSADKCQALLVNCMKKKDGGYTHLNLLNCLGNQEKEYVGPPENFSPLLKPFLLPK